MAMYRAAVKYAMDATAKEKIAALRDGLTDVALELVCEHGCSPDDVREWLERAGDEAEFAAETEKRT